MPNPESTSSGIQEKPNNHLFPLRATIELYVTCNSVTGQVAMEVYSSLGVFFYEEIVLENDLYSHQINLDNWNKGSYVLRLNSRNI